LIIDENKLFEGAVVIEALEEVLKKMGNYENSLEYRKEILREQNEVVMIMHQVPGYGLF